MKIIGVTGHQNLPNSSLSYIRKEVERVLIEYKEGITCVSSLAAGADQLFAELAFNLGSALHIVIPCKGYESTFSKKLYLKKFKELISKAKVIETLDFSNPSEEAFFHAGLRVVDLSDMIIAIWDGKKAKGKGGTADIVSYANKQNKYVIIIWPSGTNR